MHYENLILPNVVNNMGCLVGRETTQGKNLIQIKTFLYKSFLY